MVSCQGPADPAEIVRRCPEVAEANAITAPNSDVLIKAQFSLCENFLVCDLPCGKGGLYRHIKSGLLELLVTVLLDCQCRLHKMDRF